ncbi:MAG: ribonuclease III domain-containing protein, partial [Acidobacteriota bacterium]
MPTARPHADADRPRPPLDDFEIALGHRFRDRTLLMRALTHRSYSNERGLGDRSHYERLEFLGDAVLGLATAHWLFTRFPEQAEGMLAKRKSVLVSAKTLASEAKRLALGRYLRLGVGEARSGGHAKASILADAMEAVLGAVYLDGGFAA